MANAIPSGPGRKVPATKLLPEAYAGKALVRNERGQPVLRKEINGMVFETVIFEEDAAGLINE